MNLGTVPAQGPWYAFSISTGDVDLDGEPVAGTSYMITSVGEYMGERKVISRPYKKTASETPKAINPTDVTPDTTKIAGIAKGLISIGGNVRIADLGIQSVRGDITAQNLITSNDMKTRMSGNDGKANSGAFANADSNYANTLYTHVKDEVFLTDEQINAKGYSPIAFSYYNYVIPADTVVYANSTIFKSNCAITGKSNSLLYVPDDSLQYVSSITGPSNGIFFVVCNSLKPLSTLNTNGNIIIYVKNDVVILGGQLSGQNMIFANGVVYLGGSLDGKTKNPINAGTILISSDSGKTATSENGNGYAIAYWGGGFTGAFQTPGSLYIGSGSNIIYDRSVIDNLGFPSVLELHK